MKNTDDFITRYFLSDMADANWEIAHQDAEKITDIAILLIRAETAAENDDDLIAAVYLRRLLQVARFSSDYIDAAKFLRQYRPMQDYIAIDECIRQAEKLAVVPGDWSEIKQFNADGFSGTM